MARKLPHPDIDRIAREERPANAPWPRISSFAERAMRETKSQSVSLCWNNHGGSHGITDN